MLSGCGVAIFVVGRCASLKGVRRIRIGVNDLSMPMPPLIITILIAIIVLLFILVAVLIPSIIVFWEDLKKKFRRKRR